MLLHSLLFKLHTCAHTHTQTQIHIYLLICCVSFWDILCYIAQVSLELTNLLPLLLGKGLYKCQLPYLASYIYLIYEDEQLSVQ